MPDPSSPPTRGLALALVGLMLLTAMAPAASALDVSAKAIKVIGSTKYNPHTVQAYSGEASTQTPQFDGQNVAVAVLDTGVDNEHPTLQGSWIAGAELLPPYLCGGGSTCWQERDPTDNERFWDPDDKHGHGTHVASILMGRGAPGRDQAPATPSGVAPGALLVDVKIANDLGGASIDDVAKGIRWVIDYNNGETQYGPPRDRGLPKVSVISLSIGSFSPKNGEDAKDRDEAMLAIQEATDAGILVVVSAGNCGPGDGDGPAVSLDCDEAGEDRERNTITSPGAAPEALTVGAIDDQRSVQRAGDTVAGYSSRGPNPATDTSDTLWRKPDVVAPGTRIEAACHSEVGQEGDPSRLCRKSGTSMAAPHVAGLAAILFQAGRAEKPATGYSPADVKNLITSTAEDWGDIGWDVASGYGYVDGYAAIVKAVNEPPNAAFTVSPRSPDAGEEIVLDASLTDDPDEQDTIERLIWDLGDGSDPVENPGEIRVTQHIYDEPGTYTISLTAIDSQGTTDTSTTTIDVQAPPPPDRGQRPSAKLTWWPKSPRVDTPVRLDASNSSDPDGDEILRYEWDTDHIQGAFEADAKTSSPVYNWTPDRTGGQRIALRVVDDRGLATITVEGLVVRPPPPGPPVVNFTNPLEGDRLRPGSLLASWVVAENPAESFTLFIDGREDQTIKGRQVRLTLTEGPHTLRLVAHGPGGTGVDWVNVTATDESQALEANSLSDGQCTTHQHANGDRETHCKGAAKTDCREHTHADGSVEEHCGRQALPTGMVEAPPPASENQTPIPPMLAILAAALAALLGRRDPER